MNTQHNWTSHPDWKHTSTKPNSVSMEICANCGVIISRFTKDKASRWIQDTAPVGQKQLTCPDTCEETLELVIGRSFDYKLATDFIRQSQTLRDKIFTWLGL